jgi:hypothetical protein
MMSANGETGSRETGEHLDGEKTSISSKTLEEREKAIRFLNSPSIAHLSKEVKENYLKQKGFNSQDIEDLYHEINNKAFDTIWNSQIDSNGIEKQGPTQQYRQQHHQYYPHQPLNSMHDHSNDKEISLPNPMVPITIGGIIAVFGLAAFRWLNGQDFVLFPTTSHSTITDTTTKGDEILPEASSTIDNDDNHKEEDEIITQDINKLISTIENLAQIQKDTIKILEREKATKVTNVAMTALRKQSANTNVSNDDLETCDRINSSILLVQIVECKCAFDALVKECKSWDMKSQSEGSEIPARDAVLSTLSKLESIGLTLDSIQSLMKEVIHKSNSDSEKEYSNDSQATQNTVQSTPNITKAKDSSELSSEKIESINNKENSTPEDIGNDNAVIQTDPSTIIPSIESFQEAFKKLQSSNSPTLIKSGCQMLYLHISNLISHPSDKQFKRISTKSSTFKNKIGNVQFATQVLKSVGFTEEGTYLVYKSESDSNKLQDEQSSNNEHVQKRQQNQTNLNSNELALLQGAALSLKHVL